MARAENFLSEKNPENIFCASCQKIMHRARLIPLAVTLVYEAYVEPNRPFHGLYDVEHRYLARWLRERETATGPLVEISSPFFDRVWNIFAR